MIKIISGIIFLVSMFLFADTAKDYLKNKEKKYSKYELASSFTVSVAAMLFLAI